MTPRVGISVSIALLLLAGCSSSSETTTTVTLDANTTENPSESTTSTTAVEAATTTVEATTTTSAGAAGVPTGILVAGESGIVLLEGGNASTVLDQPASVAADDLMGGLVFQGPGSDSGFFGAPEESIVWWLPAGAEEPRSLLVPTGEQWLRLVGVELIDGSPAVVYIRTDNPDDFYNAIATLRTYDFEAGEVSEVRTVGGWESGTSHVTFGNGVFASNWFGEAYSGFDFFDTNGDDVVVAGDPYGDAICFDGTLEPGTEDTGAVTGGRCFENVAITPDGSRIAYTTLSSDEEGVVQSVDLVVVDAADGSELHRMPILTEAPYSISSLDIRGDTVLYNQVTFRTTRELLPATVIDLSTGEGITIPVAGTARFAPSLTAG